MFSEATVFSFEIYFSARPWLETMLDSLPLISLFSLCIILTWYNNLVFSSWMVFASNCISDAHFSWYFDEWTITFFYQELFPPDHIFKFDRYHAIWLQKSVPLMPWPSLLTIAWFILPYLIYRVCCFLLERFLYSSETLDVFFCEIFALLHIIIANFVAGNFIIVYFRCGLNVVYRQCRLNLTLLSSRN